MAELVILRDDEPRPQVRRLLERAALEAAMKGERMQFDDLPLVTGEDEARRVHRTPGLYLVNRRGRMAHGAPYDCLHIDPKQTINTPQWRVATDAGCRALGFGWCQSCS